MRYAISGSSSTLTYIALTLLVSGPLGVPIQIAIPVSYAMALVLNFTLQRHFVFPSQGASCSDGARSCGATSPPC